MQFVLEILICTIASMQSDVCVDTLVYQRHSYQDIRKCQINKIRKSIIFDAMIRQGVYGPKNIKMQADCITVSNI